SLYRCRNCGEWVLACTLDGNCVRPALSASPQIRYYTIRTEGGTSITLDPTTGQRRGEGMAGVRVAEIQRCPECGNEDDSEPFAAPFTSVAALILAILAETVVSEIPPYPSPSSAWLPG